MSLEARISRTVNAWKLGARSLWNAIFTSIGAMWPGAGYQVLDPGRKLLPAGRIHRSMSANELANLSLPELRALCRKLERDTALGRAVVEGLVAQIVGQGIDLEPDTGDKALNDIIRPFWKKYIKGCDITGSRSIFDLQSQAMRENATAGEHLWRIINLPERAERGEVPLVILPLECEWIMNEVQPKQDDSITAVNGIELDKFGRPVSYWLSNPELSLSGKAERVDAENLIHGYERRRALQARGEPWLAPVIEKIWLDDDIITAEVQATKACSAMAMVIVSKSHPTLDTTVRGTAQDPSQAIALGGVARLYPDEDIKAFSHNRPAQQIANFRRTVHGDICGGTRLDRRWLDRDYSQANFSSLRRADSDTEKLLRPVREWFGHNTIGALYKRVLPYLAIQAGIKTPPAGYRLLPDGIPYSDPVEDARAALIMIKGGLSTYREQIALRGGDVDEVWSEIEVEQEKMKAKGLTFDMDGVLAPLTPKPQQAQTTEQTDASP